jgi:hypothetical protein
VPTSQELAGDFSNVATSFYQHKFYNPYSTTCSGSTCTVQQFKCDTSGNPITPVNNIQATGTPCLKIPSSMIDPVMLSYVKAYYQTPNSLATEASGFNFSETRPQIDNANSYQVRIDYNKSEGTLALAVSA